MKELIVLVPAICLLISIVPASEKPSEPDAKELKKRYNALKKPCMALLEKFEKKTYTHTDGKTLPYRIFTGKGKKLPLVVCLHGLGGKGKDNVKQMTDQILCAGVWALEKNQARHPCVVIAPQSMGGFGTWNMLGLYPDFFAAAVPVCGKGDTSKAANIVKHGTPIWAFHGAKDPLVHVSGSREMIKAMREAGGDPLYTEYPDVKHPSWEGAYSDPKLVEWVFKQKRK